MGPEVTFIWRSADIAPKTADFPIIYRTANKKIGTLIGTLKRDEWDFYKEKYNIKYWVSAKDLFEKNQSDMTNEEKQLLLKDLCTRLPYNVIIHCTDNDTDYKCFLTTDILNELLHNTEYCNYKPYLRPISSMMQGEWEQMTALIYPHGRVNRNPENKNELLLWLSKDGNEMPISLMEKVFSWFNEHHFDYRGLIENGLALEAPEGMYNLA